MLGADTFVTKPLSPGFFRYLWQYHLRRDPEWYAGVDLNPPPAPPPPPPGESPGDSAGEPPGAAIALALADLNVSAAEQEGEAGDETACRQQ